LAFSYWIDYLGFITNGKLVAVLITPSLGVPNWSVIYIINTAPLEGQRGGVGFEVLDLGLCLERGQWGELGFTLEASMWGSRDDGVQVPTWRVEERGERGWRGSGQDLGMDGLESLLSLSFLKFKQGHGWDSS
jgi:hypothetical protein